MLRQAVLPVPVLGRVALDPKGAGLLSGEWIGRLDRSLLVRSVVNRYCTRSLLPTLKKSTSDARLSTMIAAAGVSSSQADTP